LAVLFAHIGELNRIADEIDQDLRDELRALRELRRQSTGAFVFASERGGPMTRFNVSKMVEAAGNRAGLPYAHPHMLRHTCGHLLADAGHDTRRLQLWLGHVDIKHTAHYSELSASPVQRVLEVTTLGAATASGESSENVRAFSATPKELEVRNRFASTESHNRLGNDDPDLVGIFRGMGTEDRGRALAEREPAPILQRTCRVATPPRHFQVRTNQSGKASELRGN
jgi:hypothetical protein